jgi:anti-sigma factor RsiW
MTQITFFHPGARSLQRFADGESPPGEQSRVASHLADCVSCRAKVSFTRDITAKAKNLPVVDPSADLITRVIVERRMGQRAILPTADEKERPRRVAIPLVAAAMVLVVTGVALTYMRGTRLEKGEASTGEPRTFLGSMIFLPNVASAAEAPTGVEAFKHPVAFDGRKLKPVDLDYERYSTNLSGSRTVASRGSLHVSRVSSGAWKVERDWTGTSEDGTGQLRHEVETSLLSGRDLKLISREIHVTPFLKYSRINVEQNFSGDRISGRMTTEGGDSRGVGRPIDQSLSEKYAPFITEAIAPVLMRAVSLGPDWRGSFSIVGWAVRKEDVIFPLTLRVIGSERVTVPAGTFDCWKMTITVQGHDIAYWSRKSDGIGVLTRDDSRRATTGTRGIALVSDKPTRE